MAETQREKDKRILVEMLVIVEDRLYRVVVELSHAAPQSKLKFRNEYAQFFPGPWEEIKTRFDQSRQIVQGDDLDWQYVEGIGLTGKMLEWKKRFLDQVVEEGGTTRFLKVANSLLGSLSTVIPPLEAVREYKEHVEAAMTYPNRRP